MLSMERVEHSSAIFLNFITNVPFLNLLSNPISLTKETECRIRGKALFKPPRNPPPLSPRRCLQAEMHLNCFKCDPCLLSLGSFEGFLGIHLQQGPYFNHGREKPEPRTACLDTGKAEIPAPRPCFPELSALDHSSVVMRGLWSEPG